MKGKAKFWQFRAQAEDPAVGELLLYGPISEVSWWGDEVTPKQFWEDLQALGGISELKVYVNSGGGDVFAGQAIYSMLKRHPARVTVYVDGLAASIASVVAMAGDRVIMPRNAMMMVHNPWAMVIGTAADMRKMADDLDQIRESLIAAYQEKTDLSRRRLIAMMDAETWMTAEEAVELGFADELEEAKQVAASLRGSLLVVNGLEVDLSRFRNPPKSLLAPVPYPAARGSLAVRQIAAAIRDAVKAITVKAGVVPSDVSTETAPEDTPWEAPDLEDFTDKNWDELTDEEKRRIAGHYAWAADMPPEKLGDLKLPHHRPSDGKVVWRGVAAAAQRLEQADIPAEDLEKVRRHLARHYRQFGKTPPWEQEEEASERRPPLAVFQRRLRVRQNERRMARWTR